MDHRATPVKLSVVIPVRNEEGSIPRTVRELASSLAAESIPHEILVVEDHSTDGTIGVLDSLAAEVAACRWIRNADPPGYGYAVKTGLKNFTGDAVCIVM